MRVAWAFYARVGGHDCVKLIMRGIPLYFGIRDKKADASGMWASSIY